MRMLGTIAVGMMALLASPAHAELPLVNEERVSWQGCDYAIQVREDVDPQWYWPRPLYRISVTSEVVSPSTCSLTPGTVELATSKLAPRIAIAASTEGLVVAYSFGEYARFYGDWVRIRVHALDPSTLDSVRVAGLKGAIVPPNGGAGGPGATYLGELTLHHHTLKLTGTLYGNAITEDPATVPWPYPVVKGSDFVVKEYPFLAIYPDFFDPTPRSPVLVTF
jgi:hypothetical protein